MSTASTSFRLCPSGRHAVEAKNRRSLFRRVVHVVWIRGGSCGDYLHVLPLGPFGGHKGGEGHQLSVWRGLNGVLHIYKIARMPGNLTLHVNQVARGVHLVHPHTLGRAGLVPHLPRHLLALPHLAWILACTSGTTPAVEFAGTVRCWSSLEPILLHHSLKPLADGDALDVYPLTRCEVISSNLCAHRQQSIRRDPELFQLTLVLDVVFREVASLLCIELLSLLAARPELNTIVSFIFFRFNLHNLAVVDPQHCEW
mmetsp:Transcript_14209/g.30416  ORF Transcript_14209/g.30416 Transcript_14209/m.30416 type:complete len:256 (+) Transcript_14209:57-824(+)